MKKIITIIIIIIIAGLGYWFLQEDKEGDLTFLENLEKETGIDFSEIQDTEFKWVVKVDPIVVEETVAGKGFEANVVPSEQYDKIHPFFIENGFVNV